MPPPTIYAADVMDRAKAQIGDAYIFGTETTRTDPDPEAFDCSELLEWIMESLGFPDFPDGSMNQRAYCAAHAAELTVTEGTRTFCAALFRDVNVTGVGHVALSLGDLTTVEARGSAYGVGRFSADPASRLWTEAYLIPGVTYKPRPKPPKLVQRYVVFGPHGGRWGHVNADREPEVRAKRVLKLVDEVLAKRPAAVVIERPEPKDLELVDSRNYPRWLAEKLTA